MTMAVKITNQEEEKDSANDLMIEELRADGTVAQAHVLEGGGELVFCVHSRSGLRISKRYADRMAELHPSQAAKTFDPRPAGSAERTKTTSRHRNPEDDDEGDAPG